MSHEARPLQLVAHCSGCAWFLHRVRCRLAGEEGRGAGGQLHGGARGAGQGGMRLHAAPDMPANLLRLPSLERHSTAEPALIPWRCWPLAALHTSRLAPSGTRSSPGRRRLTSIGRFGGTVQARECTVAAHAAARLARGHILVRLGGFVSVLQSLKTPRIRCFGSKFSSRGSAPHPAGAHAPDPSKG